MTRKALGFSFAFLAPASALAFAFAFIAACSTFSADEVTAPDSGSALDAPPSPDAPDVPAPDAPGPACDLSQPFRKPTVVMSLVAAERSTTSARAAGSFLYFSSDRYADAGPNPFSFVDLYRAKFAGGEFTDIVRLANPSAPAAEDVAPTETADGLTLFFARGDASVRRIVKSVRSGFGLEYPASEDVLLGGGRLVAGASAESDPYLVGNRLYFTATVSDVIRFYAADLPSLATPRVVAHDDMQKIRYPVVSADEKEVYYIRYSTDDTSSGVPYVARRGGLGEEFAAGQIATEILLDNVDATTISGISADGCDLYMSGNAHGADGFVVFRARRAGP